MSDVSLTIFKSVFDNKTDKRMDFDSWQKFEDLLFKLSERKIASKKDAELISPAIYEMGTTRSNKNVTAWAGWAAIDVDEHKFEGDLRNELNERYGKYYYVCYSTASSTIEHPKFRIVFPLVRSVAPDKIKQFWFALNTELDSIGDKQTKDLSRMYYTPATYAGANNFIFRNVGDVIDPDAFIKRHPLLKQNNSKNFIDSLPEAMQKQIIEHRKAKLANKDKYKWNGLHDCPFINRKMIAEYKAISETGWYHKMYQFLVSVAFDAIRKGYPISINEMEFLARELDRETGSWYENRPIDVEAKSALSYAYKNSEV